jgi:hypothetical protein
LSLDEIRFRLASRIIEAAGEARRLAAIDERAAALAAMAPVVWEEAWDDAVGAVAHRLAEQVGGHMEDEARAVRMSGRRTKRLRVDETKRKAISSRLGSAGAALMPALDELGHRMDRAAGATGLDRPAIEAWQESLRVAASRLEAAWLALEDAVAAETAMWQRVAHDVARWRKPWWPVTVVGAAILWVATWLGLIVGGYLGPPAWLERLWLLVVP